ncbi:MAG: hypothetical protein WC967_13555 [Balneolaceae bacterium]
MKVKLTEESVTTITNLIKLQKPFKCRVNEEESKLVQELLFSFGYLWAGNNDAQIRNVDKGSLTIGLAGAGKITCYEFSNSEQSYISWNVPEVTIKTEEVAETYTNIKEVMEALLAGKVLVSKSGNALYKLAKGEVVNCNKQRKTDWTVSYYFAEYLVPSTEYIPPKEWYEQIPEEGVLCWVWDKGDNAFTIVGIVTKYESNNTYPFITTSDCEWKHAKPVTQKDINKLIYKG